MAESCTPVYTMSSRLVKPRVGAGFQAYLIRPCGFWGGLPSQ